MTRMGVDAYLGHERAMRYHKNKVYNKEHKTYHSHHQTEIKIVRGKTWFLKFILKIWVLEIIWKLDF